MGWAALRLKGVCLWGSAEEGGQDGLRVPLLGKLGAALGPWAGAEDTSHISWGSPTNHPLLLHLKETQEPKSFFNARGSLLRAAASTDLADPRDVAPLWRRR